MSKQKQFRPATRAEHATLTRALDLALLELAHAECIKLALRRAKPDQLRRKLKRIRALLQGIPTK